MPTLDPAVTQPDLTPLPVSVLVIATWNLLEAASNLPQPRHLSVSSGGQSIELAFPTDESAERSIARWARRFGSELQTSPHQCDDGTLKRYVRAEFDYYGIAVAAYTFIPAETAT